MRVINFAPGPAALPLPVLEQARAELTDWHGSGMSVMELSHRSKAFAPVAAEAEADLRELMGIPAHYKVLFLQGGAAGQFSAVPLNLTDADSTVDYVNTGAWSRKAMAEAAHYCRVHVAADAAASGYTTVPPQSRWQLTPGAAYLHYTPNETISGVEFPFVPQADAPLVADMSSTILSRPLDVSRFGLIYAGAQKNIGPSGLVIVIVREDLLGRARRETPLIWHYQHMAADGSMTNTPPTFAWYMAGLVFKWLRQQGGLTAMAERNRAKAQLLYRTIDDSAFYRSHVEQSCRSWMNVTFYLPTPELDRAFVSAAAAEGLVNLAGHRSVGGIRASIYNAMSLEGVQALAQFMREFARRHA